MKLKLRCKILILLLLLSILPILIVGFTVIYYGSSVIKEDTFKRLTAIRNIKKNKIEAFFERSKIILESLTEFIKMVNKIEKDRINVFLERIEENIDYKLKELNKSLIFLSNLKKTYLLFSKKVRKKLSLKSYERDYVSPIVKFESLDNLIGISLNKKIIYSYLTKDIVGNNINTLDNNVVIENIFNLVLDKEDFVFYYKNNYLYIGFPVKYKEEIKGILIANMLVDNLLKDIISLPYKTSKIFIVSQDKIISRRVIDKKLSKNILNKILEKQGFYLDKETHNYYVWKSIRFLKNKLNWKIILEVPEEDKITWNNRYIDILEHYVKHHNFFYDLFIIDKYGYCLFSIMHEADYHTNLLTGKFKNTNLGRLIKKVFTSKKFEFEDFQLYEPSNYGAASFIALPILDENNEIENIVALQLSIEEIDNTIGDKERHYKTQESILIGPDKLMRSDAYLNPKDYSLKASFKNLNRINTLDIDRALNNETGIMIVKDYRDKRVLSAYTFIKVYDKKWALVVKIDEDEAFKSLIYFQRAGFLLLTLFIIGIIITGVYFSNYIINPINNVTTNLSIASESLKSASEQISKSAQDLSDGASEQASTVEEIRASLEQINSMIQQTADDSVNAKSSSENATKLAEEGKKSIENLEKIITNISFRSDDIQNLMKRIEEISLQTNILSLNAAVEASRAGEYGKGFNVVAEEIRNLAQKTKEFIKTSSKDIGQIIKDIKKSNELVKKSSILFENIFKGNKELSELVEEISYANQEQANSINEFMTSINSLETLAQKSTVNAEETAAISEELNSQSKTLVEVVNKLSMLLGEKEEVKEKAPRITYYKEFKFKDSDKKDYLSKPNIQEKEVKEIKDIKPENIIPLDEDEFKDF